MNYGKKRKGFKHILLLGIEVALLACVVVCSAGNYSAEASITMDKNVQEGTEEYFQWKEGLLGSNVALKRANVTRNGMRNEYVGFNVGGNGRFSIGTTGGNPERSTDDNSKLIYGYPGTGTSFTTINLDGIAHIYDSSNGVYDVEEQKHTSYMLVDGVRITQELKIIQNSGTNREDVVRIKYTVSNPNSGEPHEIGLRIMMDTMLGNNDAAPFRIPGYGNITTETEFEGNEIPMFWQAFDSLTNPGVIAQGRFITENGNEPDKVQFTNWGHVYSTSWGYDVQKGYNNGDSAVSIIWEKETLYTGQVKEYVTYYGISELVGDLRPPVALSVFSDATVEFDGLKYNPGVMSIVAYIQNISETTAKNIKISLVLPEDMKLSTGKKEVVISNLDVAEERQISWKVVIDETDPEENYVIQVKLEADDCDSKIVSRIIEVKKKNAKKAILVVPGIMGSNLVDKNNVSEKLWMNEGLGKAKGLWKVAAGKISCDSDGNSKNANIIPLSGESEYGALDIYKNLIVELKENFGDVADVRFVPYDWRMELEAGAAQIEKAVQEYDEVVIVAHSMGGLVTEKYLATRGTDKIIKVITAGTPYWGAPMACNTLYTGNVDAFPDFVAYVVEDIMLSILVNFNGLYELLPNEYYTNAGAWLKREEIVTKNFFDFLIGGRREVKTYDWDKTKNFYKTWFNGKLAQTAIDDHAQINMSSTVSAIDSVNHTFIVGYDVNTSVGSNLFRGNGTSGVIAYSDYSLMGDGTVPFRSAVMNRINPSMLSGEDVQKIGDYVIIKGKNHTQLVNEQTGITEIVSEVKEAYEKNALGTYTMETQGLRMMRINADELPTMNLPVRMLLAADSLIDISKDGEELYYLHEDGRKQDQNVLFEYAGKFNEMPVYMLVINKGDYDVKITSRASQNIQLAFEIGNTIYSLEDFSMEEGDVITFNTGKQEKTSFQKNGVEVKPMVVIDGVIQEDCPEGMITKDDITVLSMNVRSGEQYNNTINPRIKIVNNGEESIVLNQLALSYLFNGDGYQSHNFVCDWAAVNHVQSITDVKGSFESEGQYEILTIEFPKSELALEPGEELEIHFRIHTTDWQMYDTWNDPSLAGEDFSVNPMIGVGYMGIPVQ